MTVTRFSSILAIVVVSLFTAIQVGAQDIHFSQFFATPILTNPANTGMSGENLRFANNYRNQWAKIGVPYTTFYTSIDQKVSIANQSFGIGGVIVHDQSSTFNLSENEFLISFSYSKIINNQQFTFGLQPGYIFKSYNSGGLTYTSQFDALAQQFDASLPSLENGLSGNLHHFDLNMGMFWRTLTHTYMPSAGISISHVFRPVETFSTSSSGSRLPLKLTLNSQVIIPLKNKFDITPTFLYAATPGAKELLLGSMGGYTLDNSAISVKSIYAVTFFRINPMRDIDAVILGGGIKFTNFTLGITYDINVSPLSKTSNLNGAYEMSLIFTGGNRARKNINEPCYIY